MHELVLQHRGDDRRLRLRNSSVFPPFSLLRPQAHEHVAYFIPACYPAHCPRLQRVLPHRDGGTMRAEQSPPEDGLQLPPRQLAYPGRGPGEQKTCELSQTLPACFAAASRCCRAAGTRARATMATTNRINSMSRVYEGWLREYCGSGLSGAALRQPFAIKVESSLFAFGICARSQSKLLKGPHMSRSVPRVGGSGESP